MSTAVAEWKSTPLSNAWIIDTQFVMWARGTVGQTEKGERGCTGQNGKSW